MIKYLSLVVGFLIFSGGALRAAPLKDGVYYDWKNCIGLLEETRYGSGQDTGSIADFMTASRNGDVRTVRRLLDRGIDVNIRDRKKLTALMYAAQEGQVPVAELLMNRGADVTINYDAWDAYRIATCMGYWELARLLSPRRATNERRCITYLSKPPIVMPAIICAAIRDDTGIISDLLAKGADINGQERDWGTALIAASESGKRSTVEYLLGRGADVNVFSPHGESALISAVKKGDLDIVELLVERGADIDTSHEHWKYTSLMYAAEHGDPCLVNYLIRKGADVNKRCMDGRSALLFACLNTQCEHKYLEVIRLLIENGADLNVATKNTSSEAPNSIYNVTALLHACEKGLRETAEMLVKYGANVNIKRSDGKTALDLANYMELAQVIALLNKKHAVSGSKGSGRTALMDVALSNDSRKAEKLLTNGADVNKRDTAGKTPLMLFAVCNAKDAAKVLITHGAEVNAKDNSGVTALMFAAKYTAYSYNVGYKNGMVKLLLEHGAEVNVRDAQGKTAVTYGKKSGRTDIVALLEAAGGTE
jgi:ankyrin repeat protein